MNGTISLHDHCDRLQRDANALGVMVVGEDGAILGHAGSLAKLPEPTIDAAADLVAQVLGTPRPQVQAATENDDVVAEVGKQRACAVGLGQKAVLVVVFDDASTLQLVRLRMKRARELMLRSLSE